VLRDHQLVRIIFVTTYFTPKLDPHTVSTSTWITVISRGQFTYVNTATLLYFYIYTTNGIFFISSEYLDPTLVHESVLTFWTFETMNPRNIFYSHRLMNVFA